MHKSIRQSMAWLHAWTGLLLGWLLFNIFLFGTLSYYKNQITAWMQPQYQLQEISQTVALTSAWSYLQKNAPDAQNWYIDVARPEQPFNRIFWQKPDNSYESKNLDAQTGVEVKSTTQGGDFFYNFHFQLYQVPVIWGRIITSFAAFLMLIALISGIITHKKILTDFFTLRTFKAQRSWLDFHNVVSVIALPFFLTITFTGLAIFFYIYLPFGIQHHYPDNSRQFFQEIVEQPVQTTAQASKTAPMLPLAQIEAMIQDRWGNAELSNIRVKKPNTNLTTIVIQQNQDHSITLNNPRLAISGTTGQVLADTRRDTAISTLYAGVYGLHMGMFAQPLLRFALFLSGILGCLMIASGMLLWSLKRQLQQKTQRFHFGYYVVDRLNISTCVGLPIAILVYFYCNRLWTPNHSENAEITWFFVAWLLSFIFALITPKKRLWQSQLWVFMLLALGLPLCNLTVLYQQQWISSWQDYLHYLNFDLSICLFAVFAFFIYCKISPIQQQAKQRMRKKLNLQRENQ